MKLNVQLISEGPSRNSTVVTLIFFSHSSASFLSFWLRSETLHVEDEAQKLRLRP
jgi:hypothetical protein